MGYEVGIVKTKVSIQNGTKNCFKNKQPNSTGGQLLLQADSAPILYNNRTLVPLRLVLETFNSNVTWVPSLQQVHIQ